MIIDKLTSGRFVLTVVCSGVFALCAVKGILPVDLVGSILTMVFISYFQRNDRNNTHSPNTQ